MKIYILSLFPNLFKSVFEESIIKRAREKGKVKIHIINIRDFAKDKHKTVDDKPYGGGRGMLLKVDIVVSALESLKPKPHSILLAANGTKFNQLKARGLAKKASLAIVCGHYEGVDKRVEEFVDEVISIGEYVLTGGEIAAMAIVDSTVRLIPGVIHPDSLTSESFTNEGELEYPQYTQPNEFRGMKVPKVLLSGNHQEIEKWRKSQA